MRRRRLLGLVAGGVVGSVSGCTDSLTGLRETSPESTALPDHDGWPMAGYDAANTGHHRTASVPTTEPTERWKLTLDNPLEFRTGPIVHDGRAYIGARGNPHHYEGPFELHAVDATTGDQEWTHSLVRGKFSPAAPAAVDGTVYVRVPFQNAVEVHAIDAADGTRRWRRQLDGGIVGSFVVDDDTLVVTMGESLVALDAETGEEHWRTEIEPLPAQPAVGDGTVHVGCEDDTIRAFDLATGEQEWRYTFERELVTTPTVRDGLVYTGSGDRIVALQDGEEMWTFEHEDAVGGPGVAVDDEQVYVGGWGLFALDATTGARRWTRELGGDRALMTSPVVADGVVVIAPRGVLSAFDVRDGTRRWSVGEPGRAVGRPAVVDGWLYVAEKSGTLSAFAAQPED